MTKFIATAGIAALLALGAISAPVAASANELSAGVQQVRWDSRNPPRNSSRDFCSHSLAESRARNMGLTRVRVTNVSSRSVVVEGRNRWGRWDRIVFANERGCPVIRR
jgi:hypothetical protein